MARKKKSSLPPDDAYIVATHDGAVRCKLCNLERPTVKGLRMHYLRKHGKARGSTIKRKQSAVKREVTLAEAIEVLRVKRDGLNDVLRMLEALQ